MGFIKRSLLFGIAATALTVGSPVSGAELLVEYETGDNVLLVDPPGYVENGVLTGLNSGHAHVGGSGGSLLTNDTTGIFLNDINPSVTISLVTGSPFELISVDLGEWWNPDRDPDTFIATGFRNGVQIGTFGGPLSTTMVTYSGASLGSIDLLRIFTNSSAYGVLVLDNLRIEASVPEAKTWAMMLLGFGSIGLAIRRRRSVLVVAG